MFREFILNLIVRKTTVCVTTCGVVLDFTGTGTIYSPDCVTNLYGDEYRAALLVLQEAFSTANPAPGTLAEWSVAAGAAGLRGGRIYNVIGGHTGRGELTIQRIVHLRGLFCP